MEGYLAEIRIFAGNFAPRTWALCEGQLLPISANQALFSLLGCTYGGDCRTSFALPDLRGRVPIGAGTGAGLSHRNLGAKTGQETVTLSSTQMPSHSHRVNANSSAGNQNSPQNHFPASGQVEGVPPNTSPFNPNYSDTHDSQMASGALGNTGGSQAHTNMQPSMGISYMICLQGLFPSRS